MWLVFVIFIVPLATGLYLWRKSEPPRVIYLICFAVSLLALIIITISGKTIILLMGLGVFLSATSFFAGTFLSTFLRNYSKK